jgi:hypothetical protein
MNGLTRLIRGGLCSLAIAGGLFKAAGQVVTLTDWNATASIALASQAGLFGWTIDGQNVANQHGFWCRVGNSPEASLDTLNLWSWTLCGNTLETVYGGSGFKLRLISSLFGGVAGSGTAAFIETMIVNNTSAGPIDFHLFQYSDLLNCMPVAGSVDIFSSGSGISKSCLKTYVGARQTEGDIVCDAVFVRGASHVEAALFGSTLARLNDGTPTVLNDNLSAGPGNVTWALQWDLPLCRGQSVIITTAINVAGVPEPSALSLAALGVVAALRLCRGRKQG